MKNGAAGPQQKLFQTDVEVQNNRLSIPVPVQPELIVLLAQLMKSAVNAIESEANDEQDHR
jgi:hypothetical protein